MSKEFKAVFVFIFLNYFMPFALIMVFATGIFLPTSFPVYLGIMLFLTPIVMTILSALCIESILES